MTKISNEHKINSLKQRKDESRKVDAEIQSLQEKEKK